MESHRYAICLKFGDKPLTFVTKLVLEGKASICSLIKKSTFKLFKFLTFVAVVIIEHIFIKRSVPKRNTA